MKSEYEKIKEREKRCVCRQCGHPLKVQLIVYSRYGGSGMELVCPHCQRIDYGVEPEIYDLARKFVRDNEFNYFLDMAEDERSERLNISKVSEIFTWLFREMEICTIDGFTEEGANLSCFQKGKADESPGER